MHRLLLLVDAYSQIYRAFHAIRHLTSPTGAPVNAIFGFIKMLRKMLADTHPSHAAVVYDLGPPADRLALLPSYKAQRLPTPAALEAQLPVIRETVSALGLPIIELAGQEADDLIATLADRASAAGWPTLIASSDKDFAQLVSEQIRILRPENKVVVTLDSAAIEQRYGVRPDQFVDYLSLLGDAVDNIPGVAGIGKVTAAELIRRYGSLDALLQAAPSLPNHKVRDALLEAADQLRQNRELIRLRRNLPVSATLEDLVVRAVKTDQLRELYRTCGFKSLLAELEAGPHDLFGSR